MTQPSSTAPRRRAIVALLVMALAAVIVIGGVLWTVGSRPAPDTGGKSAWEQVLRQIKPDGEVTFETALQAFSLAVGPLPGVPMPAGRIVPIASGTGAIRWLQGYRSRLTDEQRAAVDRYLAPAPNAIRVEPATGAAPQDDAARPAWAAARPLVVYGRPRPRRPETHAAVADAPTARETEFLGYLVAARIAIEGRLGRPRGLPVAYTLAINESQLTTDLVYTRPHFGFLDRGAPSECEFRVNPSMFQPGAGTAEFKASMAHEMFHCFQAAGMSGAEQWTNTLTARPWLLEGSAEWVGETLGGPSKIGLQWWDLYLKDPKVELFARGYDAVGFYLHMVERGVDPWPHLDRMMYAANDAAYREAVTPGGDGFLYSWSSGFFKDAAVAGEWDARGPWQTSVRAPRDALDIGPGQSVPFDAKPFANAIGVVSTTADILNVKMNGTARIRGADGTVQDGLFDVNFCAGVAAECKCPPGQRYTGPVLTPLRYPAYLALTGGTGGVKGSLTGLDLGAFCRTDPTPAPTVRTSVKPPAPGGHGAPRCGQRCPGSNGDPHLFTVDGVAYDFQAAGEFVLLRTPDGSVELQTRQKPAVGIEFDRVSNNTALAVRVGDRRVAIYANEAVLEARVDGVPQTGSEPVDLGGGGRLERHANGFQIDLPDGTVVWALSRGLSGVYVLIDPSAAVVETGVGLLGRSAPGLGIPRLPDGTALPAPLDRHEAYQLLYQRFTEAWRVTDATTLFDYDTGKSTASYTVHDYPSAPKVATFQDLDPAQAAAGRQACAAVTDPALQEQCAFDVAVTGDTGYVAPYVATMLVAQQGTAGLDVPVPAAGPTASPSATEPPPSPPVEVLPVIHRLAGSALAPDGTLYVSVVMADRTGQVLAIDPLTGAILRRTTTTGAGLVAVAAGSVWVGEFTGPSLGAPPCSVSRLDPVTLAVQATIDTVCHGLGRTELAALGDEVWVVDPSGADAAGAGGTLRRIDSTTNALADSVPLPFPSGTLRASATALFYGESDKGQFRLRPGETALTRIGNPETTAFPAGIPAGDGLWSIVGSLYGLFTSANGPDGTLDLQDADGGILVAADVGSVYLDRPVAGGRHELWRRYLDGRLPVRLAVAGPTETGIGPVSLLYFDVTPFLVGETSVAKLWVMVSRSDPNESLLLVQGARLPAR